MFDHLFVKVLFQKCKPLIVLYKTVLIYAYINRLVLLYNVSFTFDLNAFTVKSGNKHYHITE
jgi:hypothetical protein